MKDVRNTGLNLKIALLSATDLVDEPGLFLLSKLKVSMSTILLFTTTLIYHILHYTIIIVKE